MKNEGNMTPLREHNNLPVTDNKDMKICCLPDKEFQIGLLRKLNELQKKKKKTQKDNSMKSGGKMHEQNGKFNKEF